MTKSLPARAFSRAYQGGLKAGNYFMGYKTPATIEGPGCIKELPSLVKSQGVNNVLIVMGPNIRKRGLAHDLTRGLDELGIKYTIFSKIQANPTDENVEAGLDAYKKSDAQGIIAFGGGSPIDCAKAIAGRIAQPKKSVEQLQGLLKIHKKIVPFWAVPTTAGTGTETTVAAVITIAKTHHKASINDTAILPKIAILDPELTVSCPPNVTAACGMDALCHAVESYVNWTYCTKYEIELSLKAVKLIYENIEEACKNGNNLKARQNMQLAAFYAGRSFTRGCVGYVHACGHPLSALYDLPHGLVMGVLLPHVMRQFGSAAYKRLAELSDYCGIPQAAAKGRKAKTKTELTDKAKAEMFIKWIEDTNAKLGLPKGFDQIKYEDISQMIKWADAEANPLYPVPVVWGEIEFRKLYGTVKRAK